MELKNANEHIGFLTQLNDEKASKVKLLEQALKQRPSSGYGNQESPETKLPMLKKHQIKL